MEEDLIIPLVEEESPEPINIESELDRFRQQWKQEISAHSRTRAPSDAADGTVSVTDDDLPSIEDQAKFLFLQGVNSEQNGRLYEAIKYYRKAVQLVPDIEFRIDEFKPGRNERPRQESECSVGGSDLGEDDEGLDDLIQHLSKMKADDTTICEPEIGTESTHIGNMPVELLITIFKWVVSMELDIHALERIASVCRGFYLCSRDHALWRLICQRIWGSNCGRSANYGTYRDMFLERPHVNFMGCYISKSTYYRAGEKSMDSFYRPIHVVEYYRMVRFFPDGQVLMMTTPEAPSFAVAKIRHRTSRAQGIQHGYFKMAGDRVTAVLRRRKQKESAGGFRYKRQRNLEPEAPEAPEHSFHLELELTHVGKKPNAKLVWQDYSVRTLYRSTGNETIADFEITPQSYPPMMFSRVRSFGAVTDSILE